MELLNYVCSSQLLQCEGAPGLVCQFLTRLLKTRDEATYMTAELGAEHTVEVTGKCVRC